MTEQRRPLAVAITGSIGAGKSTALHAFERLGAPVISSDEIVHRLLATDESLRLELVARWGERVLDEARQIDRSAVAEIVFADRAELEWLESVLHPRVSAAYLAWRDELGRRPSPPSVCVTEVPLLFESGAEERFDVVVVVTAPAKLRTARSDVSGIPERSERLLPDREKIARADFSYVNTGTPGELEEWVASVLEELAERG